MVLRKKVAIFDWEWGRNSAPRDGRKIPCTGLFPYTLKSLVNAGIDSMALF